MYTYPICLLFSSLLSMYYTRIHITAKNMDNKAEQIKVDRTVVYTSMLKKTGIYSIYNTFTSVNMSHLPLCPFCLPHLH